MGRCVHFATEPQSVTTLWLRRLLEQNPRLVLAGFP